MRLRLSVLAGVWAMGMSAGGLVAAPAAELPSERVLRFFQEHRSETIDGFLARLRPAPLDAESASRILAILPHDIVARPSRELTGKLAVARRVLDYSARGAVDIKAVPSDEALAILFFRAVLLLSTRTLDILNTDEVAAVVAHELGHEYDWNEYLSAIQRKDVSRMQELELRSDGIAVLTLERVGITPERLVSAATKMTRCNENRPAVRGDKANQNSSQGTFQRYVSLKERVAFIRQVAKLKWADVPSQSTRTRP
jgi:hypothetical protein